MVEQKHMCRGSDCVCVCQWKPKAKMNCQTMVNKLKLVTELSWWDKACCSKASSNSNIYAQIVEYKMKRIMDEFSPHLVLTSSRTMEHLTCKIIVFRLKKYLPKIRSFFAGNVSNSIVFGKKSVVWIFNVTNFKGFMTVTLLKYLSIK